MTTFKLYIKYKGYPSQYIRIVNGRRQMNDKVRELMSRPETHSVKVVRLED